MIPPVPATPPGDDQAPAMRFDVGRGLHRFDHDAMATTWEILLPGPDHEAARRTAQAAFLELDRLERELSRFIPGSDVSRLNACPPGQMIRVGPDAFECLKVSILTHFKTRGAFDATYGSSIDGVRASGMGLLELDERGLYAGASAEGLRVDLGGIGKGYAVDVMAALLREWGVESALIHGGHSTVYALGAPPEGHAWNIGLTDPGRPGAVIETARLRDRALSGSGVAVRGAHVIDPRTGEPTQARAAAWACSSSSAEADALSTAFMILPLAEVRAICDDDADIGGVALESSPGGPARPVILGRWN